MIVAVVVLVIRRELCKHPHKISPIGVRLPPAACSRSLVRRPAGPGFDVAPPTFLRTLTMLHELALDLDASAPSVGAGASGGRLLLAAGLADWRSWGAQSVAPAWRGPAQ